MDRECPIHPNPEGIALSVALVPNMDSHLRQSLSENALSRAVRRPRLTEKQGLNWQTGASASTFLEFSDRLISRWSVMSYNNNPEGIALSEALVTH